MEDEPPLTSPDGSRKSNPPERYPHPLYSQDSAQEEHSTPQVDGLIVVIVEDGEESGVRGEELGAEEEISPQISPEPGDIRGKNVRKEGNEVMIKEEEIPMDISTYGSNNRNSPERCPRPLYFQDSKQDYCRYPHHEQDDKLFTIEVEVKQEAEVANVREHERCAKEEISPQLGTDESCRKYNVKKSPSRPPDDETEDNSSEECPITPTPHPGFINGETFSCSVCGQCFPEKTEFLSHQKSHGSEKPFSCSECSKSFRHKSALITHERVHTGEKPYSCPECGKSFSQKSALIRHEKVHTGEKPYLCSECGKCFTEKSHLAYHETTHLTQKQFYCSECGKCFSHIGLLVSHRKTHVGVKTLSCSECGKCFSWKSALMRHEEVHTREKPFSCKECGKCFARRLHLANHRKSHKPYHCSECGKCYNKRGRLLVHQRTHIQNVVFSI